MPWAAGCLCPALPAFGQIISVCAACGTTPGTARFGSRQLPRLRRTFSVITLDFIETAADTRASEILIDIFEQLLCFNRLGQILVGMRQFSLDTRNEALRRGKHH